jgi:two-component system, NarL family, invasion response regulator UvrY
MADIYLVDDHALLRDGLRAVLEFAGHRVVGDGDDPTRAFSELHALAPDVLLLDLNLGHRSGFELLERMQQRDLPVRTIVLTMSEQPRDLAEALRLGAAGYLLKGSPAREVLEAVDTVVDGGEYLTERVAGWAVSAEPTGSAKTGIESLSPRERQVVLMVVRGSSSAAIGEQLHLSPKTVDSYRSRLMAKLGVRDVPALVRLAIREQLISAHEV